MKRNEGFSLVELIVVIAILAILSTAAITGVGMLGGWRANKCVSLIDGGLKETRTEALAKQNIYFTLSCDANGDYWIQVTGHPEEMVASDGITITYKTDAGTVETPVAEDNPLILSYDSASGVFLPMFERDSDSGTYVKCQTESGEHVSYVYCTAIYIRAGEGRETVINLVKSTGKHTIE